MFLLHHCNIKTLIINVFYVFFYNFKIIFCNVLNNFIMMIIFLFFIIIKDWIHIRIHIDKLRGQTTRNIC